VSSVYVTVPPETKTVGGGSATTIVNWSESVCAPPAPEFPRSLVRMVAVTFCGVPGAL
jgi:hypothetical protein